MGHLAQCLAHARTHQTEAWVKDVSVKEHVARADLTWFHLADREKAGDDEKEGT